MLRSNLSNYLLVLLVIQFVNSFRLIVHRQFKLLHVRSSPISSDDKLYIGPIALYEDMESGISIQELGIDMMIGKSTVESEIAGLGLFVALSDDVDEVKLKRATLLCGYSKGFFSNESFGTKTVAYAFDSPKIGVVYNKTVKSLIEVVQEVCNSSDMSDIVVGHEILYDSVSNTTVVIPDENYSEGRYFIPNELDNQDVSYMGTFANDLGFSDFNMSEEEYIVNSKRNNVLQIIWRMELKNEKLYPTWPVVILSKDIVLRNKEPMELGMTYCWRYWNAAKLLSEESNN